MLTEAKLTTLFEHAQIAHRNREWDKALELFAQAEQLAPGDFRLPNNIANTFWLSNRPDEAHLHYKRSVLLEPSDHRPWRGLGNSLRDLNQWEQSDTAFAISRSLTESAETDWNHSQVLMGLERFSEAWSLSERRLDVDQFQRYREQPYWQGAWGKSNEPLFVWTEQGYGDTFQFLRWITCLGERNITLEVEPPLVSLLENGLDWLANPPTIVSKQKTPKPVLKHCSLMSLPYLLGGGNLTTVAFATGPYLRLNKFSDNKIESRGQRIGIVWAAGRKLDNAFTSREYLKRSLSPTELEYLIRGLHALGIKTVNLQIGADRDELSDALANSFHEELDHDADFLKAGQTIQDLDAVVSVDTATAHQAGAQGVTCHTLLPWSADPRWLRHRIDSPWYPNMRLWRQGPDKQWIPVIDRLLSYLQKPSTSTSRQ